MKRIDLHIHTLASPLDDDFVFSMDALIEHVDHNKLDAIAITNHNLFDVRNYKSIQRALPEHVCVLPGIEVSVKGFHCLVVADPANVDEFEQTCANVPKIEQGQDGITIDEFKASFGNGAYLVIPHYKKKPFIPADDLAALGDIVTALEVSSDKKWYYERSRVEKPVVRFSDYRCCDGKGTSWGKYTYASIGSVTFDSLKLAFDDKTKFSITEREDHFEIAPGLHASLGLNVVVGGRSTGKTFFLDRLYESCDPDDVVYLRQFEIVKDAEEKAFKKRLDDEEGSIRGDYYEPMTDISTAASSLQTRDAMLKSIKDYLNDLVSYADTSARDDEFSKCPIYSQGRIAQMSAASEAKVVNSVITLLDDNTLTDEIESIIGHDRLVELLRVAITAYKRKAMQCKCVDLANEIIGKVKGGLTLESRRPACPDSPLLDAANRIAFIKRLAKLRAATKTEAIISRKPIGKFTRTTKRVPHKDANALKSAIGTTANMAGVLNLDDEAFVERILATSGVSDISHAFFNVCVELRNENDEEVSGGQKAEYLFFRALDRAASHDMVLIDEPESSFDNPFLNELIAVELKKISERATVFIATHNNVLGVSIKPDGLVYTDAANGEHRIFTCDSGDQDMVASDGTRIKRSKVLMRLMEAGNDAYEGRRPYYGLA